MESIIKKFRVKGGSPVNLGEHSTDFTGGYEKHAALPVLDKLKEEMSALQERFYGSSDRALLLIFQAMDAAGKDSVIKHVMSGVNPQGCQVFSFKQPSAEEISHDFLWRHAKALPEKGRIGIHNRSHYENVLVCKVHPELAGDMDIPEAKFWEQRYRSITDFERHLSANRTTIIKFFLNVSKEKQKERFLERLADDTKNWKFAEGDLAERKLWNRYMQVYEEALSATSTEDAPWFIIPADKKWFTRIAVAQIIVEALKIGNTGAANRLRLSKKEIADFKDEIINE